MKNYTIYNPANGEIIRSGNCQDQDFELQTIANCLTIEGKSNYTTNYVLNGQIQTYTPGQQTAKSQPQPWYMQWSNQTFSWVDSRNTDQIKQDKIVSVDAQRSELLSNSDWIVIRATDQGTPIPQAWKTYRQALRDIPTQSGYPFNVIWPVAPT